jgi:hypothetical protein
VRHGRRLEYFTNTWNALEGLVDVVAGAIARSILLVGFGIDSFIEVTSGSVLLWRMSVEGAANERAARLKETQQPVHLTRDADAHSCANERSLSNRSPKPKRTIGTEVNSVQPLVDLQCSRKPSRPSRQICKFVGLAEPFH